MGDESANGQRYTPEQIEATTQALLLLQNQLYSVPPTSLSVEDFKTWHKALAAPLGIRAGDYRTGPITFGSYFGFPPEQIAEAVSATFQRANDHLEYLGFLDEPESLEELVRVSAYVHARLIRIHPFEDGNGRVARLVLSAMFWGAGINFPELKSLQPGRYVSALNTYNHLGEDDLCCPRLEPLKKLIVELL